MAEPTSLRLGAASARQVPLPSRLLEGLGVGLSRS